jgi:3-oxoacyl-(acyl-carrier-protein) synthase
MTDTFSANCGIKWTDQSILTGCLSVRAAGAPFSWAESNRSRVLARKLPLRHEPVKVDPKYVMSNSLGFGGTNVSLILGISDL